MSDDRETIARAALEKLLAQADARVDARAVIDAMTRKCRCVAPVFELHAQELARQPGMTRTAAEAVDIIDELCRYTAAERFGVRPFLGNADAAGAYLSKLYIGVHIEHCYLLLLDADGRLIRRLLLQRGTVDRASVYVRDIAEAAIRYDAAYLVLSHNHPGGSAQPSAADCELTADAVEAAKAIRRPMLDHIIVADRVPVSIRGYARSREEVWLSQAPDSARLRDWFIKNGGD